MSTEAAPRSALIVDGSSLWASMKGLGWDMDFAALRDFTDLEARATYFATINDRQFNPMRPLADWLGRNGWEVNTRPHGAMDVDMAVAMLEMAPTVNHFFLVTGEDSLAPAVRAVQRRGCRVTVMCGGDWPQKELRVCASEIMELIDLKPRLARAGKKENV